MCQSSYAYILEYPEITLPRYWNMVMFLKCVETLKLVS
jgi:hypothetical protein